MGDCIENGIIRSAISGFYYVKTTAGIYECKAKGVFKKDGVNPLVGDRVTIETLSSQTGLITEILARKNNFVRPPVANVDVMCMVVSLVEPAPNILVLDTMLAVCERQNAEPVIVLTKSDLADNAELLQTYKKAGIAIFSAPFDSGSERDDFLDAIRDKLCVFCGNSGVGKSTLLNLLDETLKLETSEISKKLGRGKHTTRKVELFELENGCLIADAPGFSSLDIIRFGSGDKSDVQYAFREFSDYILKCKYTGCSHTGEQGCAVFAAVESGDIARSRYDSYASLYAQAKLAKHWD